MKHLLALLLLSVFLFNNCTAQSRVDLEKKRRSIDAQINKTNKQLKHTRYQQKSIKKKLQGLHQAIGSSEGVISLLHGELDTINHYIDRKIGVVEQLEKDLALLRQNYKKIIRQLYRYRLQNNALSFILSAKSFNQAYHRWIYLQNLEEKRSQQAKAIKKAQADLAKYVNALEGQKHQKNALLDQELSEQEQLLKEKSTQARQIQQLQKQERRLRANIKRKKRYKKQLSRKIASIIREQIAKAKREARRREQQRKKRTLAYSNKKKKSQQKRSKASSSFSKHKGKLMWPVYQGRVISRFGKQQHPKFKDVYINNNGIDIQGQYNSVIRSVYKGVVVSIFAIPGLNNAVMVKHGDYFTTYSNLAKVYVKTGQRIKTGAQLGSIGRDSQNGGHSMHFELWHGKQKQNPSYWLKR